MACKYKTFMTYNYTPIEMVERCERLSSQYLSDALPIYRKPGTFSLTAPSNCKFCSSPSHILAIFHLAE